MTAYTTRILDGEEALASITPAWEALRRQEERPHIEQHPAWLATEEQLSGCPRRTGGTVGLYRRDELVGIASFTRRMWSWPCRLGYATVARFPIQFADLCGETLLAPDDFQAQEALLGAVAGALPPSQMLFLESVPVDSVLWQVIERSRLIQREFWIYKPSDVTPHWWIHLPGTFQEYLAKFSGKTRQQLRSYVRKLEEACQGELHVDRVTERGQVPAFVNHLEHVSKRSWQGRQLGSIVRATEAERQRLSAWADRGWLRCYLMRSGETPIAFWTGLLADGVYMPMQTAYNPEWASYQAGKVLLYRLIEDLCDSCSPVWVNLGYGDSDYKRFFSNHGYDECNVYLIRKSAYTGLACVVHGSCGRASAAVRAALDRCGLRSRVRRLLRGRSSQPLVLVRPDRQ